MLTTATPKSTTIPVSVVVWVAVPIPIAIRLRKHFPLPAYSVKHPRALKLKVFAAALPITPPALHPHTSFKSQKFDH
jgi:hypothetical protein